LSASCTNASALSVKLRPEFVSIERSIDAVSAQESSAKWRWAPTLSGFGNVRAFNYPGFSGDQYSWALGLQLDWVLYDGGVRDVQRKLAQAQKRESEERLLQLRDNITDELYTARRGLETKRRALETARRQVELAKETLDLVRVQHDAGTATQLDLLQAQDQLVASEVAVAQARFDLELSDVQLKRSAGLFPK
jgi:outer membrane protein TolC